MNEQYLTVAEVAEMLDVSSDTVRRVFADEPGVINIGPRNRGADRPYRILRIPRAVLERFLAERAVKAGASAPRDGKTRKGR